MLDPGNEVEDDDMLDLQEKRSKYAKFDKTVFILMIVEIIQSNLSARFSKLHGSGFS